MDSMNMSLHVSGVEPFTDAGVAGEATAELIARLMVSDPEIARVGAFLMLMLDRYIKQREKELEALIDEAEEREQQ